MSKTMEITEDLIKDLKGAIALVKDKGEVITQLQTAVGAIETKLIELAQTPTFRPKELYQWDNEAQAKRFVDFCRDIHPGQKTLAGSVDADGGYTIPDEFRAVLIRLIDEFGMVRRAARVFPMNSDNMKFPTLTSGVTVYWPNENVAIRRLVQTRLLQRMMSEAPGYPGRFSRLGTIERRRCRG